MTLKKSYPAIYLNISSFIYEMKAILFTLNNFTGLNETITISLIIFFFLPLFMRNCTLLISCYFMLKINYLSFFLYLLQISPEEHSWTIFWNRYIAVPS